MSLYIFKIIIKLIMTSSRFDFGSTRVRPQFDLKNLEPFPFTVQWTVRVWKPCANVIAHLQIANHCNPRSLLTPGKTLEFEPLLYCGFCNQYAIYHEHACNNDSPWDPNNGYPSDAPLTDWWVASLGYCYFPLFVWPA